MTDRVASSLEESIKCRTEDRENWENKPAFGIDIVAALSVERRRIREEIDGAIISVMRDYTRNDVYDRISQAVAALSATINESKIKSEKINAKLYDNFNEELEIINDNHGLLLRKINKDKKTQDVINRQCDMATDKITDRLNIIENDVIDTATKLVGVHKILKDDIREINNKITLLNLEVEDIYKRLKQLEK